MANPSELVVEAIILLEGIYNTSQSLPDSDTLSSENIQSISQLMTGIQGALFSGADLYFNGLTATDFVTDVVGGSPIIGSIGALVDIVTQAAVAGEMLYKYNNGDPTVSERDVALEFGKLALITALGGFALYMGTGTAAAAAIIALSGILWDAYFDPNSWFWNSADFLYSNVEEAIIGIRQDPLILDLDGDGLELIPLAASTVYFDYSNDGFAEKTGWVGPDDGMLVFDANRNDNVDGIGELFGSPDVDGYAVLETFDTNADGLIDANDEEWAQLRVWRDLNSNGVSDAGELFTLEELGIESFSLTTTEETGTLEGHELGYTGTFTRNDGTTGSATTVYFETEQSDTTPDETGFTPLAGVELLPALPRQGMLHSIEWVASNDAGFRQAAANDNRPFSLHLTARAA